ncbi:hypothetical protein SAY86_003190 [Trapa natans]|uniref:Molybdenum cofactor sulfurase n=1 Tax=Trapa natans TaxID=22666 RepID=A0AAN7LVL6_TRANT|nr:hypothetical protein SAY86_003190 [Trapa natans]
MDRGKDDFLKEFGGDYGYPNSPKSIDEIRSTEFKRLEGHVYLDHAGATLYSELQMEAIFKELSTTVYGNPHSQSDTGTVTSDIIKEARQQVLDYFSASPREYRCVFTSGATSALKLVGEAFPWSSRSCFMYTMENHNSVLGIREYALGKGGQACAVDIEESGTYGKSSIKVCKRSSQRRYEYQDNTNAGDTCSLFALPSECNFSGVRFNLDLVKMIKEDSEKVLGGSDFCRSKWMVLIDAAKGCATEKVDLSRYPADFVVVSFYKLFGYPTGLGALILRNDSASLLRKKYFSGGTVAAAIADIDFVKRREHVEELFEDGTTSFLSIASIRHGFKLLNTLTLSAISRHTASLATFLRKMLLELKHENGANLCALYGHRVSKDLGPTISFNLRRPDGSWFGYREVEKLASLSGIQLRTGCFCNPGACAKYIGLSHQDIWSNVEAGHVCWDDNDILNGKPTGAVRVSFGYMSTYEDAKKLLDFLKGSFATSGNHCSLPCTKRLSSGQGIRVKSIHIYPIKSCAGFSAPSWPLSSTGFLHDRAWVLKSLTGEILTQKTVPILCLIGTYIDLSRGVLVVQSPLCKDKLEIDINPYSGNLGEEQVDLYSRRHNSSYDTL